MSENQMTATEVQNRQTLLFGEMPEWAKHAFFHCQVVHNVIYHCSTNGSTTEETAWRVAELLYQDRNNYRDSLMTQFRTQPPQR